MTKMTKMMVRKDIPRRAKATSLPTRRTMASISEKARVAEAAEPEELQQQKDIAARALKELERVVNSKQKKKDKRWTRNLSGSGVWNWLRNFWS
jgi:hypothetical protein